MDQPDDILHALAIVPDDSIDRMATVYGLKREAGEDAAALRRRIAERLMRAPTLLPLPAACAYNDVWEREIYFYALYPVLWAAPQVVGGGVFLRCERVDWHGWT